MKNKAFDADCTFEKKKWISITGLCNNNCVFCLDKERPDKFHKTTEEIKSQIQKGKEEGCTKLILSGGDPTIHPNVIDFVKYGRETGYPKIQLITNGRMFSSKEFTDKIIEAGLDEVTFSIHGFNSKMHDSLTRVKGSLKQIMHGVKNVFDNPKKVIVNTDTCITKSNYRHLPKIIQFIVEKVGINEVNLISIVPQGNAWKYKDDVIYDYEEVTPYVHKVIDYCTAKNVVLWVSRFPPEYLEGYEEFIEGPYKMVDDVRGYGNSLKDTARPICKGERCNYCSIKSICSDLIKINYCDTIKNKEYDAKIEITKDNISKIKGLVDEKKKTLLIFAEPTKRAGEYKEKVPDINEAASFLKEVDYANVSICGIPPCILLKEKIKNIHYVKKRDINYERYISNEEKDFLGLAEELSRIVSTKSCKCKECLFSEDCSGIYQNYARIFGFKCLTPIKSNEIRINMECNQNCLFCNTDENAENTTLEKETTLEKIKEFSNQKTNYLIISGKEPTLDENLLAYVQFAQENGFIKIELQTNAMKCADKEYVEKIKQAGLTDAFVSLHAADEEFSAKITQAPGTFEKTIEGIKNLKNEKISVTINIVINSLNYRQLEEIVEFVHKEINPKTIVFSFVAPIQKAWENKEIIPRITDALPYIEKAFDYCKKNSIEFHIPSRCGIPLCFVEKYKENHDDFKESARFSNKSDKIKNAECKNCVYDKKCSGFWENYAKIYGTEEIKPQIRIKDVDLNLGKVCNNDCKFCMSSGQAEHPQFADYDKLKNEIISTALKEYEKITFLGGEPTIHPRILDLIKLARKNGFKRIHVVSNGRKYADKEFLTNMVQKGVNAFSVSIHSHIKETEDFLTGREGGYDEKIQGIKNFVDIQNDNRNVAPVFVNIVLNKKNCEKLDETVEFFKNIGITHFRINSMMSHSGNAKKNAGTLLPKISESVQVINKILDMKGIEVILGDFPLCIFENFDSHEKISNDSPTTNIIYDSDEKGETRLSFNWQSKKKNDMKIKTSKCQNCKLNKNCEGLWKDYYLVFGDEELNPIK